MTEARPIGVGDDVRVFLDGGSWLSAGWFEGRVVRIERYSEHRSFYWVELNVDIVAAGGERARRVSVLNPKNLERR